MTEKANEPEWKEEEAEVSLEKVHLLELRKDYAGALALLTEMSVKFPGNPDIPSLTEEITNKLKERDEKRRSERNPFAILCVWRNPIIFFIWMAFAFFLVGYGVMRDGYLLRDAFSMGITSPIRVDVEWDQSTYGAGQVMGPGLVANWISWTSPIYENLLIFTLVGVLGFLMVRVAWRDICRAPAWTDLESGNVSPDSVWIRRIWWW